MFALKKFPECETICREIIAIAENKIHGYIKQVVNPPLKSKGFIKNEGQKTAAIGIGIVPDMCAVA